MSVHHRRRRLASLATAATVAVVLPAVGTTLAAGPAQSADPVSDCVAPFPVAELEAGDEVDGLTVVRGTTPTGFTGEVLGIIEGGIAPGIDMIMVELAMPEFSRTGGIWQGMSGSPVYAADGRLIGAVAYGLAYGPSPIAGVTPFEEMDDYLATPVGRTGLEAADAQLVAERTGITTAQASRGFRELPMPLGVGGVTARRLAQLQADGPDFVEKSTYVLGRTSAAAAGPETMVAGGNLAASAAFGDVALAGVGTATSVCEGRVVGFGHPLALLGGTTLGLHPADAVFVQPDPVSAPFKVANIAPAVGTVTDDRTTGITGSFGTAPSGTVITSTVGYGTRTRTGSTSVSVPEFAADATLYQLIANQDRVVDGPSRGSMLLGWQVTGTEDGEPFTLSYLDRWTGTDLTFEANVGVAELVYYLGSYDGVTLDSVTAEADVTDDLTRHTIAAVEQWRGERWVRVTSRAPAVGRAGHKLRFRVIVGGSAGAQVLPLSPFAVPKRATGPILLIAQGGDGLWSSASGDTVGELAASLQGQLRHDQVRVQVGTPDAIDLGYDFEDEFGFRRARRLSFARTRTTAPLDHVVGGTKRFTVVLR